MDKIKRLIKKLKFQKIHLDYIAGILSIPVLITAIIINWGSLHKTNSPTSSPLPSTQVVVVNPEGNAGTNSNNSVIPASSSGEVCKKTVGPVDITSPKEGQEITDSPVCITISYPDSSYCSVVWSYKINNGQWSNYNNNSPCLYNLPDGNVQFQLKVQSTASEDTKTLTRNFNYQGPTGSSAPSSSPSPSPSPSHEATSSGTP